MWKTYWGTSWRTKSSDHACFSKLILYGKLSGISIPALPKRRYLWTRAKNHNPVPKHKTVSNVDHMLQACPHLLPAVSTNTGWSLSLLSHSCAKLNKLPTIKLSTSARALMLLISMIFSIGEDSTRPGGNDCGYLNSNIDSWSAGLLQVISKIDS